MGEIRPNPNIVIDPEYELWREDKEYWWTKLEEIKKQFMYRSLDKFNLSEFEIKLHEWQSHVNNIFGVKDKQLTYSDACRKLFVGYGWFFTDAEGGIHHTLGGNTYSCANNSATKHQLECILAKNKLVNVAKYLNDGWKPAVEDTSWYIISYGNNNIDIVNDYFQHSSCSSRIIFKTKELAQQAIEILGEKIIKLALEPLGI